MFTALRLLRNLFCISFLKLDRFAYLDADASNA